MRMGNQSLHKKGGNFFDNMRIDIDFAFDIVNQMEQNGTKKIKKNILVDYFHKFHYLINVYGKNKWEAKIITGIEREWFNEFLDFWGGGVGRTPVKYYGLSHVADAL